jgi:hypothetical protein
MKNSTVEYVIARFPYPILPTVQGEPNYHTIHSISKLLRANARSIETHLGGGSLGHLSIIVLIATYSTIAPAHPWVNLLTPGWGPAGINEGTAGQLAAERHRWEKDAVTIRPWNTVEQALKKQIIMVFEPLYVGFAKTTARDILEHLFLSYGSITAFDLEHNFENIQKAWDPQHPVETLFKQIQDCVDYAEAGASPSVRRRS